MNLKKILAPRQSDLDTFSYSKKVGDYLIGCLLGKGAFASVNESLHSLTGEKVAVKIIDKQLCQKDKYIKKHFYREGKIMRKLHHRHIVQLLEIMETETSYYLIMELCSINLMTKIKSKTSLSESETRLYMKQLILAVDYLHKSYIMHRDLKVENILLTHDDILKLADFGISIQLNPSNSLNLPKIYSEENQLCKTQCGSLAYAAPEVLSKLSYNFSADTWSIGVNMFVMLTGILPFSVKPFSIQAMRDKMINREMTHLPDYISKECQQLLLKFLDPNPSARIKLSIAINDPWMVSAHLTSSVQSYTDRIQSIPIHSSIVQFMEENLNFTKTDIIKSVLENSPSPAFATYILLLKKTTKLAALEKLPTNHFFQSASSKIGKLNSTYPIKAIQSSQPLNGISNSDIIEKKEKSKLAALSINPNPIQKVSSINTVSTAVNVRTSDNFVLLNNRQRISLNKIKSSLDMRTYLPSAKYNVSKPVVQLMDGYNPSHFSSFHGQKYSFSQLPQSSVNFKPKELRRLSVMEEIWRMHRSKLKRNTSMESSDFLKLDQIFKRN